jgi:biotin carboxylase
MNILIVGTIRPSHEYLLNLGHQVVLFMPQDQAVPEDLSARYAHLVCLGKGTPNTVWCGLAEVIHATLPIDYVVCFTDLCQNLAFDLAQRLGVRCMVQNDVLQNTSNKYSMRQVLATAGIESCKYQFISNEIELLAAVQIIGFPCIVKPVAGQASLNVVKLEKASDIAQAIELLGQEVILAGMIVEEFMSGIEYSVEGVSVGGQHHLVAITDKYKDTKTFVEIGHAVPAQVDAGQAAAIKDYVEQVLSALGFVDGPSHTELIMTASGPRIIETHTRLGGDRIMELVRLATGVDLYELTARQSIGEPIGDLLPSMPKSRQSAAIWFATPAASDAMVLSKVTGIEEAKMSEGVNLVVILKKPGIRGTQVRHSYDRSAFAIAVGKDNQEALKNAKAAVAHMQFTYQMDTTLCDG